MNVLGEVNDYDELITALRARVDQLGISYKLLEEISGLADGHVGKLLGEGQVKILGPTSLGLMLQGLAVRLIVVEDVEAARKMEPRWEKCASHWRRKYNHAHVLRTARVRRANSRWMRDNSRLLAAARMQKIPENMRIYYARRAARARWRRTRERANGLKQPADRGGINGK